MSNKDTRSERAEKPSEGTTGTSFEQLIKEAEDRYRIYREYQDVTQIGKRMAHPMPDSPAPGRSLFGTSFEQLIKENG